MILVTGIVRVPLYVMLMVLEPVIRVVLGGLALLGLLVAFFFKFAGVPHLHFWFLIVASVGCGLILAGYHAVLRCVAPRGTL